MKIKLNYFIDLLSAISFLVVALTGLVIFFFLPGGARRGGYQEFLGVTKLVYVEIHNWAGMLFLILVIIHVVLHWQWIVCMTKSLLKNSKINNKTYDSCEK